MTPARLRPLAELDLVERTQHYSSQRGNGLARRFFDAALAALRAIEAMPGIGSPRTGELCDVPGLRVQRIVGSPCAWY